MTYYNSTEYILSMEYIFGRATQCHVLLEQVVDAMYGVKNVKWFQVPIDPHEAAGSFAELGKVIHGVKNGRLLTPYMA